MNNIQCLFYGTAAFDYIFLIDEMPISDQRIQAKRYVESGGGPAATAAASLQSIGLQTGIITAIGDDIAGKLIKEDLINRQIDTEEVVTFQDKHSTVTSIYVEELTGNRAITSYGGCLNYLSPEDVNEKRIQSVPYVHLDGNNFELAFHVASIAKENNTKVSLDGGNMSKENIEAILPCVDIFIPDQKTVNNEYPEKSLKEACQYFSTFGPNVICITMGSNGAILFDGKYFFTIPSYPANIIDTTGAGDNFHGAFLYGLISNWSLQKTAHFASAFAALTCQGLGGRSAFPTVAEVEKLIKNNNIINIW